MWPLWSSLLIFPVRLHSKAFVSGAGFGLQGWELEAGCEGCAGLLPLLKRRLTAARCGDSFSRSSSELETMWISSGSGPSSRKLPRCLQSLSRRWSGRPPAYQQAFVLE